MNRLFSINSQICHPVVCPVCGGAWPVPPVALSPTEFKIWTAIRCSPDGLSASALAAQVYADRYAAPKHAKTVIYMTIKHANRRLAAAGIKIANTDHVRGGVYKIERIGGMS